MSVTYTSSFRVTYAQPPIVLIPPTSQVSAPNIDPQMAIDPVGLTIGLVGLFTASLDVLDRISTAKAYRKDYQLFVTKAETERFRLRRWGQVVGLAREDGVSVQHELLQDSMIEEKVCELLMENVGEYTFLPRRQETPVIAAASNNSRGWAGIQMRSTSAMSTSTMMKMKWALSGKKKSEELLQNLIYFVDKLYELVPTSGIHPTRTSEKPPAATNNTLSIRRQSRTMQLRIENRIGHSARLAIFGGMQGWVCTSGTHRCTFASQARHNDVTTLFMHFLY
ncbi:hypothetical protein BDD12DRAFT_808506 [Trichophaea hybrida]|nr:hypothetical protein BDD12DRAFT_808506 [Trichophaea hybrida]